MSYKDITRRKIYLRYTYMKNRCYRNKELIPTEVRENLIEEMADVMICLEQLKVIFHINEEELKCWIETKENRLLTREGLKE